MVSSRISLVPVAVFLHGVLIHPLWAELKWDAVKIDLEPQRPDTVVESKFGFVNAGTEVATIESVQSSCGCTVATLEKKTYAAGERGEVVVKFNTTGRRGSQSPTVRVTTRSERLPTVLTLNLTIQEVADLKPSMLSWTQGEKPESKFIEVNSLPNQPLHVTGVTSSSSSFKARVETVEGAEKYRIVVTPESTERPIFTRLDIKTQTTEGEVNLHANAQVSLPGGIGHPATRPPRAEVSLDPSVLVWQQHGLVAPQTIAVRDPSGGRVMSVKATPSSSNFTSSVEASPKAGEFQITVTPVSTAVEELAFVRIELESETGLQTQRAYIQIEAIAK